MQEEEEEEEAADEDEDEDEDEDDEDEDDEDEDDEVKEAVDASDDEARGHSCTKTLSSWPPFWYNVMLIDDGRRRSTLTDRAAVPHRHAESDGARPPGPQCGCGRANSQAHDRRGS